MNKVLAVLLGASFLILAELLPPVIPNAVAQSVTIDRDGISIDRRGRIDRQDAHESLDAMASIASEASTGAADTGSSLVRRAGAATS
jgi:hypothetical protein